MGGFFSRSDCFFNTLYIQQYCDYLNMVCVCVRTVCSFYAWLLAFDHIKFSVIMAALIMSNQTFKERNIYVCLKKSKGKQI